MFYTLWPCDLDICPLNRFTGYPFPSCRFLASWGLSVLELDLRPRHTTDRQINTAHFIMHPPYGGRGMVCLGLRSNSRTERPQEAKIDRMETCNQWTYLKDKGQGHDKGLPREVVLTPIQSLQPRHWPHQLFSDRSNTAWFKGRYCRRVAFSRGTPTCLS